MAVGVCDSHFIFWLDFLKILFSLKTQCHAQLFEEIEE